MSTAHAVLYLYPRELDAPVRFGFIVSKAVGNAVTRNLVRRRLRAIAHELLPSLGSGTDVVLRALPGLDTLTWSDLHEEISSSLMSRLAPR
jgi:ribonuclease P protein component